MNFPQSERRALGCVMRWAEQRGMIAAPAELRERVALSPLSAREIDEGLDLLVDRNGRTIGGSLQLPDLTPDQQQRLVEAEIAVWSGGALTLTSKGHELSQLLDEYASGRHQWRSLILDPTTEQEAQA